MARKVSSFTDTVRSAVGDAAVFEVVGEAATGALPRRHYNATGSPQRIKGVHVAAGTAPTGADLEVDVKVGGSSVFAAAKDRPKVAKGKHAAQAVVARHLRATVEDGDYVTVGVTAIGSTIKGSDLVVQVLFA